MLHEPMPQQIQSLERPHPKLWTYYVLSALLTGPGVLFSLPYFYFRYHTLRYRFDEEGVHMRVGILFRREVNLTYARIQDIHLHSNLIQRWLGLANVQLQTASGSAGAEMVIEGFQEFEAIRDFLYTRMRGYRAAEGRGSALPAASGPGAGTDADEVALLLEIRNELRRVREALESKNSPANSAASGAASASTSSPHPRV
jgi:putative membrane protein